MADNDVGGAVAQFGACLDAYLDGELPPDDLSSWLASYQAGLAGQVGPAWETVARRLWILASEIENGYTDPQVVRRGLAAVGNTSSG
jgi:hypothetical protein